MSVDAGVLDANVLLSALLSPHGVLDILYRVAEGSFRSGHFNCANRRKKPLERVAAPLRKLGVVVRAANSPKIP
ncbi:MAG: hypothetical protein LBD68_00210 [Zoogloeaceae bacterium]|nr:hypothetical protein [Zoogloeaceae bacterium]